MQEAGLDIISAEIYHTCEIICSSEVETMAKKLKEKIYLRFAERKSWVKAVYIDNTEYINIGFKPNKNKESVRDEKGRKENN